MGMGITFLIWADVISEETRERALRWNRSLKCSDVKFDFSSSRIFTELRIDALYPNAERTNGPRKSKSTSYLTSRIAGNTPSSVLGVMSGVTPKIPIGGNQTDCVFVLTRKDKKIWVAQQKMTNGYFQGMQLCHLSIP